MGKCRYQHTLYCHADQANQCRYTSRFRLTMHSYKYSPVSCNRGFYLPISPTAGWGISSVPVLQELRDILLCVISDDLYPKLRPCQQCATIKVGGVLTSAQTGSNITYVCADVDYVKPLHVVDDSLMPWIHTILQIVRNLLRCTKVWLFYII